MANTLRVSCGSFPLITSLSYERTAAKYTVYLFIAINPDKSPCPPTHKQSEMPIISTTTMELQTPLTNIYYLTLHPYNNIPLSFIIHSNWCTNTVQTHQWPSGSSCSRYAFSPKLHSTSVKWIPSHSSIFTIRYILYIMYVCNVCILIGLRKGSHQHH